MYLYDMRYTTLMPLPAAYEEQQFVSAITGLWNRHAPTLLVLLADIDVQWLNLTSSPSGWLAGRTLTPLPTLTDLISAFAPLGVVLYDPSVPSTSLLASTVAGSEGLLPVPYRPDDNTSLYSRVVAAGPRLPVGRTLVGAFNATSPPAHSAKGNAYAWGIDTYLFTNASDGRYLGYYADAYCGSAEPYVSDPTAYEKITVSNQDWVIAQGGFLFDLSSWTDEAPVDDPAQPLGTDAAAFEAMLRAVYTQSLSHAPPGGPPPLAHIAGFTPWWCKYVGPFSKHNHGGVDAEWNTALLTSAFNAYVDADACCIGNMASASFWQHAPLPDRLVQRPPPSRASLIASSLLSPDGTVQQGMLYYFIYAGDFDSAAWAYSQLLPRWVDPARGSLPIGWPVDPELSLRFPPIFTLMYATATANDVIITGDSGAGYVNPTAMYGPTRAVISGLPDGRAAWAAHNTPWYRQFGMSYTGFVITGDAPQMGVDDEGVYANFSGNGLTQQGFPGFVEHMAGNLPVAGQTDIPASDVAGAVGAVSAHLPATPSSPPRFWMFRSVLTSPTYLLNVSDAVRTSTGGRGVLVDPLTLAYLQRVAQGGSNDDRVTYVGDTLPSTAPSGQPLAFTATVRNDGWNALPAGNHSLSVTLTAVQSYSARVGGQRPVRVGDAPPTLSTLTARLASGALPRFPSNPSLAAILLKRYGGTSVGQGCRVTAWGAGQAPVLQPFPADLPLSGTVDVTVTLPIPSRRALMEGGCGELDPSGTLLVAEISYTVVATRADGSAYDFSGNGNIPWLAAVALQ